MSEYNITLEDLLHAWDDLILARHLYLRYRDPNKSYDSGNDNEWSDENHSTYTLALLNDSYNRSGFLGKVTRWYPYVLKAEENFRNVANQYYKSIGKEDWADLLNKRFDYIGIGNRLSPVVMKSLDFNSPLWDTELDFLYNKKLEDDVNKHSNDLLEPAYHKMLKAELDYGLKTLQLQDRLQKIIDYANLSDEERNRLITDLVADATYVDLPLSRVNPLIVNTSVPILEPLREVVIDQYRDPLPGEVRLTSLDLENIANLYEAMRSMYAPFGSPGMDAMLSNSREWALNNPYAALATNQLAMEINPVKVAVEQLPWFAGPAVIGSGLRFVGNAMEGVDALSNAGKWVYNIGNKLGRLLSIAEADRVAGILADEGTEGATEALTRAAEAYTAPEGVPITNDITINLGNGELRTINPVREVKVPSTAESIAGQIEPEVVDLEIKPKIDISELTTREAVAYDSTLDDLVEALTKNGFNEEDIATLSSELMKDLVTAEIENGAKNTTEAINNVKRAIATIASGAATLAMAAEDGNEGENSSGVSKSAIGIGLTASAYILSLIFFRMRRSAPGTSSKRALFWKYEGKGNKPKKVRLKDREYQYNLLLKELAAAMSEPKGETTKKLALIKKIEDRGIVLEGETIEDKINAINKDMKDVRLLLVKGNKPLFMEGSKYDMYTKSDESISGEEVEENSTAKAITSKDKYRIKNRRARNAARAALLGAMATGIGLTAYDMISDHQVKKRQKSADEEAVLNDTNSTLPTPQGASQDLVAQPIDSTRIRIFEDIVKLLPDSLKENKAPN